MKYQAYLPLNFFLDPKDNLLILDFYNHLQVCLSL